MLEILFLVFLTGKVGKIVEEKGHKSGKYKFYTVLLWFVGEIAGAILGALLFGGSSDTQCALYIVALLGAGAGAALAFGIANGAEDLNYNKRLGGLGSAPLAGPAASDVSQVNKPQ